MCVGLCVCVSVDARARVYLCVPACVRVCACVRACVHSSVHVCMHVYLHVLYMCNSLWRGIIFTPEFGGFGSFQAVALLFGWLSIHRGLCQVSRCRSSIGQEIHGENSERLLVQQ